MNVDKLKKMLMAAALGEKVEETPGEGMVPVIEEDDGDPTGEIEFFQVPTSEHTLPAKPGAEKAEVKKPDAKKPVKKGKTQVLIDFEKAEWGVHLGDDIPEEFTKPSTLMLYGDGVWLRRVNPLGAFTTKLRDANLPALPSGPETGTFEFALPKIPSSILKEMVSFYRQVMARFRGAEAYAIVFYDKEEKKYFMHVPSQKVSGGSVHYDQEKLREVYPSSRYLEVISAHSHNSMSAYFSSIDDNDEKGDMLYLVMGQLNKPSPAYKMRANTGGKQCCFLGLEEIFDYTDEEWAAETPEWKNVHSKKWLEALNISSTYTSPHSLGAGTSRRGTSKYQFNKKRGPVTWPTESAGGLPSPKSWPTSRPVGTQQSFNFGANRGTADYENLFIGYTALELAKDIRMMPVDQAFGAFFEALSTAGYVQEIKQGLDYSGVGDLLNITETEEEDLDTLYEEFQKILERDNE